MSTNETKLHNCRTWLIIINRYKQCRQQKLPWMPSHEWKLHHPDNSDKDLRREDMSYECGTWCHIRCRMKLAVVIRRNWGPRLGWGEDRSIEFPNLGPEESNQLVFPFFWLFSYLLHTSLLHWISARYIWSRHGFFPPPNGSQVQVELAYVPDPPKDHPERYWSVVGLIGLYKYICSKFVYYFLSFDVSFSLQRYMQPRRSAPKEGDNVTTVHDPGTGNSHSI